MHAMRADLYARKSTADEGRSVAVQEREWRADCLAEGIEPGQVFVDPDLSASRYARKARPDYGALLNHIRSGTCEMVSIREASRGSRDLGTWIAFLDACRDHAVLIRVIEDGGQTFDPRRQRDRNALVDLGQHAETETDQLSRRVRGGTRDAATQGRPPGPLLYGYRREYGAPVADSVSAGGSRRREIKQVVDDVEAAVVRRLARDTLAGKPLHTQARTLNAEGVPTPSGKGKWVGAHVNRLLRNPGIVGDRVHNGEIVARDAWPALISREDFRGLKALLEAPGRRRHHDSRLTHWLSGGAFCGACDGALRMQRTGRYACVADSCGKTSARAEKLEEAVSQAIKARLAEPDARAALVAQPDTAEVERLQREIDDLRDHLDSFYAQAAARKLSAEGLAKVEAAVRPDIERLERRQQALSTPPALRELEGVDVVATWDDLPPATRRSVVLALAEIRLSRVGKGGRWSAARLGQSRWVGDEKTWAEHGLV